MVGSRVMGLWSNGSWYPGTVSERRDRRGEQQFFVQFDDGDTAWLTLTQIRVQGAPAGAPTSGHAPFPGARVRGDWAEDSWYPGYVAEPNENATLFFVQFDDGDTKWLAPTKIRPHGDLPNAPPTPGLTPGTAVQGEWSSDSWYPGVVARANANATLFFIQFDDGDTKWLPAPQLRFTTMAPAPAPSRSAVAPPITAAPSTAAPIAAALAPEMRCAYCNPRLTGQAMSRCSECGARL